VAKEKSGIRVFDMKLMKRDSKYAWKSNKEMDDLWIK
jgi:hypothetical protein